MDISPWVRTHSQQVKKGGHVLDLACGSGRHTRYLLEKGFEVTAVDIDISGVQDLHTHPRCHLIEADLENAPWPIESKFDGIVVTNYLHRPLFKDLANTLVTGGILIYQTFMVGNEKYGKPSNPAFLLSPSELKEAFQDLEIIDFSEGYRDHGTPAITQQICARKTS